ncbi:MAG: hypothetical protein ACPGXK_02080 [Phycisphaerae bacterium]
MTEFLEAINPIHGFSLLVCILLVVGVVMRRVRTVHIPLMVSAIAIDLAMVLYIEFSRGAVKSAQAKLGTLMIVHIAISIGVLVLYGIHVYTGIRMSRGAKVGGIHGKIMIPTVGLRILNLITSIMVMAMKGGGG